MSLPKYNGSSPVVVPSKDVEDALFVVVVYERQQDETEIVSIRARDIPYRLSQYKQRNGLSATQQTACDQRSNP